MFGRPLSIDVLASPRDLRVRKLVFVCHRARKMKTARLEQGPDSDCLFETERELILAFR
jgi:hypothetical protein